MQGNVVSISRREKFSLIQAREILPIVRKITEEHKAKVETLMSRLEIIDLNNVLLIDALEEEVNQLLDNWKAKVGRLGGLAKGLWLVDFNSGDGMYCWKYPEADIYYWHGYDEGMSGRITVADKEIVDKCFRPN